MQLSNEILPDPEIKTTPAEQAERVFSDPNITEAERVMVLLGLAEDRAAKAGCESCERNRLELAAKARAYFSAKAGETEVSIEECLLPYYGARRVCEEEIYLHFYGSDRLVR